MNDRELLPSGWETAAIGALCDLINGRAFKPRDWTDAGLPIVRIQNLNDPSKPFNRFDGEVKDKYYIDDNELLFAWSGTPGTSFGAHIWDRGRAILNQHIYRVVFSESALDRRYFRYAINQKLDELIRVAHGGVGLRHVTKPVFEATRVRIAPLNEQRRIVDRIEALQARSTAAKEALDAIPPLLEKFRQSVLAAAFRGDLTAAWRAANPDVEPASELLDRIRAERRTRWIADAAEKGRARAEKRARKAGKPWTAADDEKALEKARKQAEKKYQPPEPVDPEGLPELPEGWCWASVDELAFIESGQTPKGVDSNATPEGAVPWYRVSDMNLPANLTVMTEATVRLSPETCAALGLRVQPPGTIIFPKRGGAIRTNKKRVLSEPATYDLNVMGLVPLRGAAQWLTEWFRGVDLGRLADGTSIPQINNGDIKPLHVPLAPSQEAEHVVQLIARARVWRGAVRDSYASATEQVPSLDQSILARAFRGELVPQDPSDEPASALLDRIRAEREAAEAEASAAKKAARAAKAAAKKRGRA